MADVVIQGMEMPKDCSYCKMAYDGAWCLLSEESNDCVEGGMMWRKCPYGGRPSWCPLVPLPEGHGRLIDADALNLDSEVEMADDWKTAHEIANVVKYAPTIVPAEGGVNNA